MFKNDKYKYVLRTRNIRLSYMFTKNLIYNLINLQVLYPYFDL